MHIPKLLVMHACMYNIHVHVHVRVGCLYMCPALEQTSDKLVEMTLDSAPEATPTDTSSIPLVGTVTANDSDSDDSAPAVDMEEYTGEDDDPVQHVMLLSCDIRVIPCDLCACHMIII